MSAPPVSPSPQKKSNVLLIIILVVVGLIGISIIASVTFGLFVAHKVQQAVRHGGAANILGLITAANPDAEVLSTDEGGRTVTIRDKHTGKTVTLSFDDIEHGRLTIAGDGKRVRIDANPNGDPGVSVRSSDGEVVRVGQSNAKLPLWIPTYPGTPALEGSVTSHKPGEDAGSAQFHLPDSADKVAAYYADALKSAGYTLTRSAGPVVVVAGVNEDKGRNVTYTLTPSDGGVMVSVTYSGKS